MMIMLNHQKMFTVSRTVTEPTQALIDLLNVTIPQTVVKIIDNDSEFLFPMHTP